jgi:hypothetical protein
MGFPQPLNSIRIKRCRNNRNALSIRIHVRVEHANLFPGVLGLCDELQVRGGLLILIVEGFVLEKTLPIDVVANVGVIRCTAFAGRAG